jgi:hypothetical protein
MFIALRDFYETWINCLAHPDNVQNLYASCAGSRSGSHIQVKEVWLGFHARSLSPKPYKGFSCTLSQTLTTSRPYAEPFFASPRTIYIYIYILKTVCYFFFIFPKMPFLFDASENENFDICKWRLQMVYCN